MRHPRRKFLKHAVIGTACLTCSVAGPATAIAGVLVDRPREGEDIIAFITRTRGAWDEVLFKQLLGAANEFKEGDAILGVAAADETSRTHARSLLERTTLSAIDAHTPHRDQLAGYIGQRRPSAERPLPQDMTLGQLKEFLLTSSEQEIHRIKANLSSDVIACVVKLMSNEELIKVSANLFNSLPGSHIGARGYLGARIQPNSPTDNVDDIRWQVLNGFSFAVGDVLLGTNPVSSNPEAVLAVEQTLQDILKTFGIDQAMPHCVLTHIDIQAAVETDHPGATALWFQSIAGNDAANGTFDVSVDKLKTYARGRTGPFGLYFETGQGADFTNGQADGCDMVLLESRKYGLARSLSCEVADARGAPAWVHVNDVAGFIGPEVFRSREQLVRCCLEDLVMGKLHGLTIGLDVCSTLHMDVTLSDLDWCLEQVAPAAPAYLMALPTKIDPMLGYLTTGYQDHVRLRDQFGLRVNDVMHKFFQDLQVIDAAGKPTEHFGDPVWVYWQFRKRQGDTRSRDAIEREAEEQLAAVRKRGVFIARGYGQRPSELAPRLAGEIDKIYTDAKQCIWQEWRNEFTKRIPDSVALRTQSKDRTDYIWHPESGEKLSADSINTLQSLKAKHEGRYVGQIIISEGLNALALMDEGNLLPLVELIRRDAERIGMKLAPENLVVTSGRVRAGYKIGEQLFGGLSGPRTVLHIIGERPGSGHHTLSVYITRTEGSTWQQAGQVDHNITRVVSGIATTALTPQLAAREVQRLLV